MNYMPNKKSPGFSRGFTIVEIIIVIALIGVLSAFFINTSTNSLKKGRDGKRKSDLEQIRSGIETYRADCDTYPLSLTFGGALTGNDSTIRCPSTTLYMSLTPQDPQNAQGLSYLYWSNGVTYQICATLETGSGSVTCGGASNCGTGVCNYQVISP